MARAYPPEFRKKVLNLLARQSLSLSVPLSVQVSR